MEGHAKRMHFGGAELDTSELSSSNLMVIFP